MKEYFEIMDVMAREVYNLDGDKTIEVEVTLDDGTVGTAAVSAKMIEGKEVSLAARNVDTEIAEALVGLNALDQAYIDRVILEVDGNEGKRLGTNATLATSFAVCKAAAKSSGLSLFNYIGGIKAKSVPEVVCDCDGKRGQKWYPTLTALYTDISNYDVICGGNTEDTIMAHIAVAAGIKKMVARPNVQNELIRIAEEIGE